MCPRNSQVIAAARQKSQTLIMRTALTLFATQGYHNTTISQITAKAGISKGLLYHYFTSKEQLVEGIVLEAVDTAETMINHGLDYQHPQQSLTAMIKMSFAAIQNNVEYWRFITALSLQPYIQKTIMEKLAGRVAMSIQKIEGLYRNMGKKQAALHARLLVAACDGVALHYLSNFEENYPLQDMQEAIIAQFCV
jgi:AcrR family transcriptional regulator